MEQFPQDEEAVEELVVVPAAAPSPSNIVELEEVAPVGEGVLDILEDDV